MLVETVNLPVDNCKDLHEPLAPATGMKNHFDFHPQINIDHHKPICVPSDLSAFYNQNQINQQTLIKPFNKKANRNGCCNHLPICAKTL